MIGNTNAMNLKLLHEMDDAIDRELAPELSRLLKHLRRELTVAWTVNRLLEASSSSVTESYLKMVGELLERRPARQPAKTAEQVGDTVERMLGMLMQGGPFQGGRSSGHTPKPDEVQEMRNIFDQDMPRSTGVVLCCRTMVVDGDVVLARGESGAFETSSGLEVPDLAVVKWRPATRAEADRYLKEQETNGARAYVEGAPPLVPGVVASCKTTVTADPVLLMRMSGGELIMPSGMPVADVLIVSCRPAQASEDRAFRLALDAHGALAQAMSRLSDLQRQQASKKAPGEVMERDYEVIKSSPFDVRDAVIFGLVGSRDLLLYRATIEDLWQDLAGQFVSTQEIEHYRHTTEEEANEYHERRKSLMRPAVEEPAVAVMTEVQPVGLERKIKGAPVVKQGQGGHWISGRPTGDIQGYIIVEAQDGLRKQTACVYRMGRNGWRDGNGTLIHSNMIRRWRNPATEEINEFERLASKRQKSKAA